MTLVGSSASSYRYTSSISYFTTLGITNLESLRQRRALSLLGPGFTINS